MTELKAFLEKKDIFYYIILFYIFCPSVLCHPLPCCDWFQLRPEPCWSICWCRPLEIERFHTNCSLQVARRCQASFVLVLIMNINKWLFSLSNDSAKIIESDSSCLSPYLHSDPKKICFVCVPTCIVCLASVQHSCPDEQLNRCSHILK